MSLATEDQVVLLSHLQPGTTEQNVRDSPVRRFGTILQIMVWTSHKPKHYAMVTFETPEAASRSIRAQQIVGLHGTWDIERPHSTMWLLWNAPRMPGRNDCERRDSTCASGRQQHTAWLSEETSPIVLLSSSSKRNASSHAIFRNHSSRSQLSLDGSAQEHSLPLLNPQQQPNLSRFQVSQLIHSSDANAQKPPTPGSGGESEGKRRLAPLEQKLEEKGQLLNTAVDALQAEIAKRKALEAELEDWRVKGRMMSELLKAMLSLEALVDSGSLSENTSPMKHSSPTGTPSSEGDERRKRARI